MTFLSPASAIVALALAGPALLLLYFLKLRRRPARVSSTMLWTQAVRDLQVNVPFRMIRPSWLLLLQLLALLLLIGALGRPAIHGAAPAPDVAVILIDHSASMSARDGESGGTRLEDAVRAASAFVDEIARAPSPPAVVLVAFAATAEALAGPTTDLRLVRDALGRITPTDQPADVRGALRLAESFAPVDADEATERARTLVVICSDGGFESGEPQAVAATEVRFLRAGPVAGEAPPFDNVGIVALAARRDFRDPAVVRVFARLVGPPGVALPAVLLIDEREYDRMPVVLADDDGSGVGRASLTFEITTRQAALVTVRLDRPDLLGADDSASLVLAPATRPGILIVRPDGDPPGDWLLADVLRELDPASLVEVGATRYDELGASLLAGIDLVVFDGARPRTLPPVATLSFGPGPPTPGLRIAPAEPRLSSFLTWQRTHAVMRHVSLDAVRYEPAAWLSHDEGAAGTRFEELARGPGGAAIALVEDRGVRRIAVGFDLARSTWPVHVSFPIFIANAVDVLTLRGEAEAGVSFRTDEAVSIPPPPPRAPGGEPVNLGVIARAGVHRPTAGVVVAVNLLSENESLLRTADSLAISGRPVAASQPGDTPAAPREVWPWFVLAAGLLLAVEWVLYALGMRVRPR
ncbi:MAG: VWA domain-containing protein [Phycisphaeraceae bacterium]|nr:VWA domain-containing protein [Phycisphaeraceae bacterium]